MAQTREYRTADKSAWGDGAWQSEPDKIQFVDAATGLDCLMVRNHGGAWCGYVGVPEGHPFHRVDYNQCALPVKCSESYCDHSPESRLSAHGGITFADGCHEPTPELWNRWRTTMHANREEAKRYPIGDSAEAWRELGHFIDDYEGWAQHIRETAICHMVEDGRPDKIWWLGFDTAHSGDFSPKWDGRGRPLDILNRRSDSYKDRSYVEGEIRSLAKQLVAVAEGC